MQSMKIKERNSKYKKCICIILISLIIISNNIIIINPNNSVALENEKGISSSVNKINKISELNTEEEIDSHEGETDNSRLELNYREKVEINKRILNSNNEELKYIVYPRLKKLTKEDEEGYKYILTFHKCLPNEDGTSYTSNGEKIYYTRSKDLKLWDEPQILFGTENDITKHQFKVYNKDNVEETRTADIYYSSSDSYVLNDGTIMSISSTYAKNMGSYFLSVFNVCGLYVKYSYDNGKTWTNEQKIFTGTCWEPSILQLKSGEIQVYFTQVSHVQYMNGYYPSNYPNYWIPILSNQSQSTGVGMISSLDGGKTWTPNIEGVEEKGGEEGKEDAYNENERNPYTAYRISQATVKRSTDNSIVNYKKLYYWSDTLKKWTVHKGIKKDDDTIIKMTDQMPVAVELNKGKIVLAVEATKITKGEDVEDTSNTDEDYVKTHTTDGIHNISLAYSEKTSVNIQNSNGDIETKDKYWLDLSNNTDNSNNTYASEEEIYSGEGLGLTEEGPINKTDDVFTGAGPYITQFPSGETVLSYLENDTNSEYYRKTIVRLGDTDGVFTNNNISINAAGTWSSLQLLSSHSVASIISKTDTEGKTIEINPMYLNHTITADKLSKEQSTSEDILWNNNTDALFIGSESQAQMSLRTAYDENNIYFLVDRLDNNLTDDDKIELYINTNEKNSIYYKIVLSKEGIQNLYYCNGNNTEIDKSELSSKIYVNDTNNENGGYKFFVAIPKEVLGEINEEININAVLYNKDEENEIIQDTFEGININDVTTWNKVKFENKSEEIKYNITDILLIKRHILAGNKESWKLKGDNFTKLDINKDEIINVTDLMLVKRIILMLL